ncbi:MAG: sulfurtransferase [Nostoc sp. ChiSLP02]|nr:sulfurtransferase [Nostoc sp. DedSLP05]MDZ8098796.1 sulfurtransferase [Nostoc sp. DedSLP01]MDZ8183590.1 sulfurtransferase [Nostoc sp. ChiSLP02]
MSQYIHSNILVDTQWIFERLNDPHIRLIQADMNPHAYNTGHIPGAVFWNVTTDLLLPDYRINFDRAAWEKLLANSGITSKTTVVAYGDFPATSAWLFWLFKVFGHSDVRVFNGNYQKWLSEGRPVAIESEAIAPTEYQLQTLDANLRAFSHDVRESIGTDSVLVDVRTPQEYSGEWFFMQPPQGTERAGHIPGAVSVYYELALNEDGTFKSVEELQKLYTSKGITSDKEVITYCAVGGRSAHTWFVLKYLLGYSKVRNYDGSWNEWSRISNMPIE